MDKSCQKPQKLPFLEAVCWQTADVRDLSLEEMLHRYERGWHYRHIFALLSAEELEFVKQLCNQYGSWITMDFNLEQHQKALTILTKLNADFLQSCCAYFGGGTFLTFKYNEYRVSRDIDFLCSSRQGYRLMRQEIYDRGYRAIFTDQDGIFLPREIQANQYGIRFPVVVDKLTIKFEIITEGRIELDEPEHFDWLPLACLNQVDCFAQKLLANADRWLDTSVVSRDLIDLAVQRLDAEIPDTAIAKAESAYPVIEPLKRAIANFQAQPDYRDTCYHSLQIKSPKTIIDGLDHLAADFGLPVTQRTYLEID